MRWYGIELYHQNRNGQSYIPNSRASFRVYDAAGSTNDTHTLGNSSVSDAILSILRTLLLDRIINGTSTLEKHMRRWLDIYLLARLRAAFLNFKDIALTFPSFEQVTVILVPYPLAPVNPSQRQLSLNQTFGILQPDLNSATARAVLSQNWTIAKIERKFSKRQKQKSNVDTEVQMPMSLNTNETSTSGLFPYLGSSKLSCFICNQSLYSIPNVWAIHDKRVVSTNYGLCRGRIGFRLVRQQRLIYQRKRRLRRN